MLVKEWILNSYEKSEIVEDKVIDSHFLAVSANQDLCKQFGINSANIFPIWD